MLAIRTSRFSFPSFLGCFGRPAIAASYVLRRSRDFGLAIALAVLVCAPMSAVRATPELATRSVVAQKLKKTSYDVTMTTSFVIPEGKDGLGRITVFHALPPIRPWSKNTDGYGVAKPKFDPPNAIIEQDADTKTYHAVWRVDGPHEPGTKLSFTTHMSVVSANRELNPKVASMTWKEFERQAEKDAEHAAVDSADVNSELAELAARMKAKYKPVEAVQQMCEWIVREIHYDASVLYDSRDVESTLKNRKGHCGHQASVFGQLMRSAGVPVRFVNGMNLYAKDGRTSPLQSVRADYTNIHTWAEVHFPNAGWIEVDPGMGTKAFDVPPQYIQNNNRFQNYKVRIVENGEEKEPSWIKVGNGYRSDYALENIIRFEQK